MTTDRASRACTAVTTCAASAVWIGATASAVAAPPGMLPTNLPDVFAFPAPPAGFDPIHAGDADLRTYGFPPRPNPFHDRRAYAGWARMVRAARIRVAPVLTRTNVRHMKMVPAGFDKAHGSLLYATNWSGDAVTNGATGFGNGSFYTLWGEFNIPIAEQAFGVCTGGTEYSATWIGMDGFDAASKDVVQAGTESDATCVNGATTGTYYAWYEWYPAYETRTNLPVSPGDDMGVQVDVLSAVSAGAFITNETTNEYEAIGFGPPQGTRFIGNSAEWIVERPEVNNNLSSLANYVTDFMCNTVTLLYGSNTAILGGIGAPNIPNSQVTMVVSQNNQTVISAPLVLGGGGLVYHAEGPTK
jgi:hypothetical protein